MSRSILTPLQLTASAALLAGQGIRGVPAALSTAVQTFNSIALFENLNAARDLAGNSKLEQGDGNWCSQPTLQRLQTISGTAPSQCWALADSTSPVGTALPLVYSPSGLSGLAIQTVERYLGVASITQFAQNFMAVSGYISIANDFINSAINANQYLGVTYTGMNNLITGDISQVSTDLGALGQDLQRQGQLWDPGNIELYGTPAGLLQQISRVAGIQNHSLPGIEAAMLTQGMTQQDIADLVNNNRQSLFNPDGLSNNQFDTLQKQAYQAMAQVDPADVSLVLDILDVSTPGITKLTDLLDPKQVFPASYPSLTTVSPDGSMPVFDANGTLRSAVQPVVNSYLPTQSGCDELGKIIPPESAVANKAIQVAFAQIPNIAALTLPELANTVQQSVARPWDPDTDYQPNDMVAINVPGAPGYANTVPAANVAPVYYRAQQVVPVGVDINNTDYWAQDQLPGISNLTNLDLLNAATALSPVPQSVVDYFDQNLASGTGPNGTLTMCDLLGTAVDRNGLAGKFDTVTQLIQQLDSAEVLDDLLEIYQRMQSVASGAYGNPETGPVEIPTGPGAGSYSTAVPVYAGDAALQALIPFANTAIQTIAANPTVSAVIAQLNQTWDEIVSSLNQERVLQQRGGIDYFETVPANQVSVMALVGNLPNYARQVAACQTAEFLEQIADTATLGGQAIVGALREGRNQSQLNAAGVFVNTGIPADPEVTPVAAIVPVR